MSRLTKDDIREVLRSELKKIEILTRAALNVKEGLQDPEVVAVYKDLVDKDYPATPFEVVKDVVESYRKLKNEEKENI